MICRCYRCFGSPSLTDMYVLGRSEGALRSWARREVLFSLPFVGAPGVNYIRVPCFQLGVPATTLPPSARCWRFRYNQGLCFPEQG